jgi:hypothetical protein
MAGRAAASAAGALLVSLVRPARWAPSLTRSGSRGGDGPGAGGGGGDPRAPGTDGGWAPYGLAAGALLTAASGAAQSSAQCMQGTPQADSGVLSRGAGMLAELQASGD